MKQILFYSLLGSLCAVHANALEYLGACDASAGVSIDADRFVIANDEDNLLRIYSLQKGGEALVLKDVGLGLGKKEEADLEGAAKVGDLIFWIGSHGANKNGKLRPSRHVFFATNAQLQMQGNVVHNLVEKMDDVVSADLQTANGLAPELQGALNIEGLASGPDGTIWIGFRNPVDEKGALVVPLKNPRDVVRGISPEFGTPLRLPLQGLGIRSMEWNPVEKQFWIVAGSFDDAGVFKLFRWNGTPTDVPHALNISIPKGFRPEGLFFLNDQAILISDDGGKKCNTDHPAFRTMQIQARN